jgi:ABC-type multidrug transport system fused ATPase/permease subunit
LLPAVLLAAHFMRKRLKSARAHVQADAGKAMQHLQEALQGFVESHVYGRKRFFTDRYYRHQRRLNEHLAEVQIAQWIPGRLVELFAVAGLFLLILINRHFGTVIDTISIGAFIAAAYKIIPGIGRIANLSAQIRTYQYTAGALATVDYTATGEDPQAPPAIQRIGFRNVTFAHDDKPVLRQYSLQLERGDFACLSAVSGRGKTTLLNLLLGFLSPSEGEILINGAPAGAAGLRRWQKRIAYVKQQTFLIHDTIRRNITLSEAAEDPERLQYALTHAGLAPFIAGFAEGVDKVITDSGRNVSGGQRQRIALARALYKQADVLILDEPFNELDNAAEAHMLQHMRQLAGEGRIVILVSHGGDSAAYCNKSLRIDD